MTQTNLPGWLTRSIAAARHDAKKTGVLVVLVVLLGVMGFRTFGPGNAKPAAASAAAHTGSGKIAPAPQASRAAGVNSDLLKWAEGPVSPISRNLFSVRLEYFPVEGPRNGAGLHDAGDEGFWARLEKSLILQADQRDKRENQIANYKAQATQLKLQSTIMGLRPKAMLNGEMVGEGDVVASFRVLKIEARRVIIEREGIRLEIQMK